MTEEIIIDGVNVAGCEKLGETVDGITCGLGKRIRFANEIITKHNLCKDNPDCYYKQLKRLEQENKELRQQYNCYACDTCQGKEDYRNMKRHCKNAIKTVHTYRSALEEIREIAKFNQFYNPEDLLINGDIGQIQDLKMTEIYNRINEVLNE